MIKSAQINQRGNRQGSARKNLPPWGRSALCLGMAGILLLVWGPRSLAARAPAAPTVAAASSLQGAFREIAGLFARQQGSRPTLVFGASGSLAHQIENGAPYDLFASADAHLIRQLAAGGRIESGTISIYAEGRLALVLSKRMGGVDLPGAGKPILALLTRPEFKVIAIANPRIAPYGRAAREALLGAGLWERLNARLIYGQNVRQALTFVASGNAEAALVAASLLPSGASEGSSPLHWRLLPAGGHQPIQQTVGVVRGAKAREAALGFIALLKSPQGGRILNRHRFLLPDPSGTRHKTGARR